jgi:hypothetical protein
VGKNKDNKNKELKKESSGNDQKPKPGKGRDTMFRAVFMTQVTQNQIADNKASIMISINTTIISALVAVTAYSSDSGFLDEENRIYLIPVLCIILTALVSIVFAIQSARPKVVNIHKSQTKKSSLLFFGVIASFTQEEYVTELETVINNGDEIYRHMSIDLHNQGIVLKRKFNLLSYSYQAFLVGFVLSVLLFMGLILIV